LVWAVKNDQAKGTNTWRGWSAPRNGRQRCSLGAGVECNVIQVPKGKKKGGTIRPSRVRGGATWGSREQGPIPSRKPATGSQKRNFGDLSEHGTKKKEKRKKLWFTKIHGRKTGVIILNEGGRKKTRDGGKGGGRCVNKRKF